MNVFERRYFNLNKWLFILTGLWPYEFRTKMAWRSLFFGGPFVLSMPQLFSVIVHYKDVDRLMMSLLIFIIMMIYCLKILALFVREEQLRALCESIVDNWMTIRDENERQILREHSEIGRKLTIFYAVWLSMVRVLMCLPPMIPKMLDKIDPSPEPRANIYVLQGELFIDRDEYFAQYYLYEITTMTLAGTGSIAIDSMYLACGQHSCALYAIVRSRLEILLKPNPLASEDDDSQDRLIHAIELHKKALDFTSLLNDSFFITLIVILPLYFVTIPLAACAILMNLHNPVGLAPYVACISAVMFSLVLYCWPGQRILDHGLSLQDAVYCNEWHAMPIRKKKLLLTFMLRCSKPATLNAGGLFQLNFETLAMITKTAASYITVLASFRY